MLDESYRIFTAADLAELPHELPSGPALYELDNGRLIAMSPPGNRHAQIEARLTAALFNLCSEKGFGEVRCGEVGIVLRRAPDRVVGADVAFLSKARLPIRESPEGYLETIPDLVVEIMSRRDTRAYLERKTADYLQSGVRVIWVIDPERREAVEHRPGAAPRTIAAGEELLAEDVLPGLRVPLSELLKD